MPNFEHYSKSVYEPVHEGSLESTENGLRARKFGQEGMIGQTQVT